jgi:hypothetical protein
MNSNMEFWIRTNGFGTLLVRIPHSVFVRHIRNK